jgi:cation diffusion facilitator CzcD-associated flavoprotein CzcO
MRIFSADHNSSFDYSNKRIGVIGGGSSAIQIVPQLQKLAGTHLSCFIRSKTWISTTFGASAMQKLGLDHEECMPVHDLLYMNSFPWGRGN